MSGIPARAYCGFAAEGELSVASLLASLQLSATRWDAAEPGLALNQRLVSIEPDAPLTLNDVLQAGRGDIGTQPLRGSRLPAAPNEAAGGARRGAHAGRNVGRSLGNPVLSGAAGALGSVGSALAARSRPWAAAGAAQPADRRQPVGRRAARRQPVRRSRGGRRGLID